MSATRKTQWGMGDPVLGLYEVKCLLGKGGFGEVYKVFHPSWNRDLAMKVPRPDKFKTPRDVEAFENEAETWVKLGWHPNTVKCYYVRRNKNTPLVFAEYLSEGSLENCIRSRKLYEGGTQAAIKRILDIAIQSAWGLHHAHENDLIHQDVKPANVMMGDGVTVKVTDFGLAKATAIPKGNGEESLQKTLVTDAGAMTIGYCSPEQARGEKLTRRTDLWSWAVSVVQMFTGELIWGHGGAAPEYVSSDLPDQLGANDLPKMPSDLVDLLNRCFREKQDTRPHDMMLVADELREIYKSNVAEDYPRPEPIAADLLADDLNNQAISLLDLGRQKEARKKLEQAYKSDPYNLIAVYNHGLIRWRCGELTDLELVEQLEDFLVGTEEEWRMKWMLGQVHLERGDLQAAQKALEESNQIKPDSDEVKAGFEALKKLKAEGIDEIKTFECDTIDPNAKSKVTAVALSPDDKYVLTGTSQGVLELWDWKASKFYKKLSFGKKTEYSCRTSSILAKQRGIIFKGNHFDPNKEPNKHDTAISCITFSPDGHHIAVGMGTQVRLFMNIHSTKKTKEGVSEWGYYKSPEELEKLGNPNHLIVIDLFEELVPEEKAKIISSKRSRRVSSLTFTHDGHYLVAANMDQTLDVINIQTRQITSSVVFDHPLVSIDASPGKNHLIFFGGNYMADKITILSLVDDDLHVLKEIVGTQQAEQFMTAGVFIGKEKILSGSTDGTLRIWNVNTGKCENKSILSKGQPDSTYRGTGKPYRLLNLYTDHSKRIALSLCTGGLTKIWELSTRKCIKTQKNGLPIKIEDPLDSIHPIDPYYSCINHHSNSIAISRDGVIIVGNIEDEFNSSSNKFHLLRGFSIAFKAPLEIAVPNFGSKVFDDTTYANQLTEVAKKTLSNGKIIQSLSAIDKLRKIPGRGRNQNVCELNRTVGLFCRPTKLRQYWKARQLNGHVERVLALDISQDSHWVLSGSWDGFARLWDIKTGECLSKFGWHEKCISSVSISPNGRFAVTGAYDGFCRVWSLPKGNFIYQFDIPNGKSYSEFTPLGHPPRQSGVYVSPIIPDNHFILTRDSGAIWGCVVMFFLPY